MKIFFATWLIERSHGRSLTKKKAGRRLLSYYFLLEQEVSTSLLNKYCLTGRCDPRKRK